MEAKEIIKVLEDQDVIATDFTGAFVGSCQLDDDLYQDYTKEYKKELMQMYSDKKFYNKNGGWGMFEKIKRTEYVNRYVAFLKEHNVEIDSIDFISENTLFVNLKSVNA